VKSIRRDLTLHLLLGISLLLGAGGAIIYLSTRATLLDQFDASLRGKALTMAGAIKQEGDKLEIEFRDNTTPALGGTNASEYYEVRTVDGAGLRKSRSLGQTNLPRDWGTIEAPRFFDLDLPAGIKGRGVGVRFVPRYEKRGSREVKVPELGLVLAHDRLKLDRSLNSLRWAFALGGAATLAATVLLVALVLRRGLAPLERLARDVESINAGSLQMRFPAGGLPAELDPICARLNDLLARLELSFNEISEYSAKVAHELRTPLTILRFKVEQSSGRMPPELAEELHTGLHQLTHVVEQSLLIARAEQGRLTVQPRTFDLAALVADVAGDFSLLAQEEERRVVFDKTAPCFVNADPKYARQIIHNILANALKHGHGDIQVKLTAGSNGSELTITNPVRHEATSSEETLGIGLRVVDSLLALQPGLKCERQRTQQEFVVRLSFPASNPEHPLEGMPNESASR
jgi:signal transduction histidine kinase